jgi:hypothetical protein
MTRPDVTQLTQLLQEILTLTSSDLVREAELGKALAFTDGESDFRNVRTIATRLLAADLEMLPPNMVSQLIGYATSTRDALKTISTFTPAAGQDAKGTQVSYLTNLRSYYEQFASLGGTALSLASRPELDVTDIRRRADEALAELRSKIDETRALQDKAAADAQRTVSSLQAAAGAGGVARYTKLFGDEASAHRSASLKWLWATGLLGLGTLVNAGWALSSAPGIPRDASVAESIQYGLGKLLIFTVLVSAVIWSGRVYRAHQHNYIVNRHRQIALTTFETFVENAGDPETKSAVLRQTTESIFALQPTGYVSHDADPSTTGTGQILEIVRNIGGGKT